MKDKIIEIAKQDLDDYRLELESLLALEKDNISKHELMQARQNIDKLSMAINEVLGEE